MPNSIDNKIVEMQFDNSNFEKNVKQSIKTLEKLNQALELEDAAKGFEQMEKAAEQIDLSKLTKAAELIEKRFSAAGIAGAAVINRLVNGVINKVEGLGNKVVSLAKSGGIARALKLEHANFMLNGILKNEQKVADILNGPVNKAVSGTAYGLDAAANAAGQFVAAGVTDLGKLETALSAISGVAAMSSSSYDEIARIFNKVASRGKVMGDTIQELSTRGIAAQEELAKYLKKTTLEVQEMQKKGEISFEIFSNAMYDAFAEQAKKANETFEGAMSNVKAALSRIGAKVATPALEAIRKNLVALIDVINQVSEHLSKGIIPKIVNFIKHLGYIGPLTLKSKRFIDMLKGAIDTLDRVFTDICMVMMTVRSAFKKVFPGDVIDNVNNLNKGLNSLLDIFELTDEKAAYLQMTLEGVFYAFDILFTIAGQVIDLLLPGMSKVSDTTDDVGTKILRVTATISVLLGHLDKWLKTNNLLQAGLGLVAAGIAKVTDESSIFYKIASGISTVIMTIVGVVYTIGSAIGSFLYQVYRLPIVQTIINDIKTAFVRLGDLAAPALLVISAACESLMGNLEKFSAGGYITKGLDRLNDALSNLYWGAQNVVGGIGSIFNIFKKGDDAVEKAEKVSVAFEKMAASGENLGVTSGVVVRSAGAIEQSLNTVAETSEQVANTAENTMMTLDKAGKIFAIGFGASLISAGVNIGRAFKQIAGVARNIKATTKSIKFFFDQLQLNLRIKTLLSLAVAVAVFAGSLYILARLDPARLILASVAIGALTYAMSKCALMLSTTESLAVKRFQTASKGMLEFAGALLILAAAIKVLSSFGHDWASLAASAGAMIVIMYAMAGVVILIGRYQKNAIQGTTSLLAFAGSLYIIMEALQKVQTLNLSAIKDAIPLLLEIMGGLALITVAMSLVISPFGGLVFVGVVAGIVLLCEELSRLGGIDRKALTQVKSIIDEIALALKSIMVVLVFVKMMEVIKVAMDLLLVRARGLVGNLKNIFAVLQKGVKYIGVAAMIIAIGGAIALIGKTMIELSAALQNNPAAIVAAGAIVAVLFAVIAWIMTILIETTSNVLAANKQAMWLGPALLGISAAILGVVGAIAILGSIKDVTVYEEGLFRLIEVIGLLTAFIFILSVIQNAVGETLKSSVTTWAGIAILLGVMVGAVAVLGILASTDYETYRYALEGLAVIMGGLAVVLFATGKLASFTPSATVALFGLATLFVVLGLVFAYVADVYDHSIAGIINLAAIEIAVLAMAVIVKTIGDLDGGTLAKGLLIVAGISAIFLLLAVAFTQIAAIDTDSMYNNIVKIGNSLLLLSIVVGVLGAFSSATGIGTIILIGIAAALLMVASSAVVFGVGVTLIATGVNILAGAFTILKDIDIVTIADGIFQFGISLLSIAGGVAILGLVTPALLSFGLGCTFAAMPALMFATAINVLSMGLNMLMALDLTGLLAQFIRIGQAIDFVVERALKFAVFAGIAFAVGTACLSLTAGLIAVSIGLGTVSMAISSFILAIDLLTLGISNIVSVVETLGNIVNKIFENMSKMATDLQSLGRNTVYEIYAALTSCGQAILPSAGEVMSEYVVKGFKDGFSQNAQGAGQIVVEYLFQGIKDEVYNRIQEMYDIGYEAIDEFCNGMEEAGEINSPSKRTARDGGYLVEGVVDGVDDKRQDLVKAGADMSDAVIYDGFRETAGIHSRSTETYEAGEYMVEGAHDGVEENLDQGVEAGSDLSNSIGGTLFDGISQWLTAAAQNIKDFVSDPVGFISKGMESVTKEVEEKMASYSSSYAKHKKYGTSLEFDVGIKNGTIISIPGVGYFNRETGEVKDLINGTTDALSAETEALLENAGATGKNSGSKSKNAKANEKKTKEIKEETDALDEETEAAEDNSEAIRELAEQIYVVTRAYDANLDTLAFHDKFKMARKEVKALGQAFSQSFTANADGTAKSLKQISDIFKAAEKTIPSASKNIAKGLYAFSDTKYDKKLTKSFSKMKNLATNVKKIEKQVMKTGSTIFKVNANSAKAFYKEGSKVEQLLIRLPKKMKNLGKYFNEARSVAKRFANENTNSMVKSTSSIEEFVVNLRDIEKYFVKLGKMPKGVKKYLTSITNQLQEFDGPMRILAKNIDGIANYNSKMSQSTAYVADSILSLASALYDGSEAANEYATEQARLEFLYENGEAEWEEVEEHRRAYIDRAKEALVDYYNSITETLSGQMDIFKAFDLQIDAQTENLLNNIESQIAGFRNWSNGLMELSKRGFSFDILKMLTDQGTQSYGTVMNLLKMTEGELALFEIRYQQASTAIQNAADTAVAALANARTKATLQAASKSKKLTKAQMEESKKAAKQIADNNKAVAKNQAIYNKMNAKEEKEYLKALTKKQRKEYKETKRKEKALQKQRETLAAQEEAKRALEETTAAEKERIAGIKEAIDTYEKYLKTIKEYANDTSVMKSITEDLTKAMEPMSEVISNMEDLSLDAAQHAILSFADSLEATGEEGLNYFEEMTKRVQNYISTLKDAIKSQLDYRSVIEKSKDAVTGTQIFDNMYSNAEAARTINVLAKQLAQRAIGIDISNIIADINKDISNSNLGEAWAKLEEYLKLDPTSLSAINTELKETDTLADNLAKSFTATAISLAYDSNLQQKAANQLAEYERLNKAYADAAEARQARVNRITEAANSANYYRSLIENGQGMIETLEYKINRTQEEEAELRKLRDDVARSVIEYDRYTSDVNNYTRELSDFDSQYNLTDMLNAANTAYALWQQYTADVSANMAEVDRNIAEAAKRAEREAVAFAEEQKRYNIRKLTKELKESITSYDTLREALNKAEKAFVNIGASSKDFRDEINKSIKHVTDTFDKSLRLVQNRFKITMTFLRTGSGGSVTQKITKTVDEISTAFLKLADAIQTSTESTGDYFKDVENKLTEYRDSLDSTIRGQVSLFEEFKKYSGDKATGAGTYLDNMQSQIEGLSEWMENLNILSERGVSGDIVKMFAAEGQNSFEKVAAFANATDAQLGELIKRYQEYQKITDEAADTVLAAVVNSYTATAENLGASLLKAFERSGMERTKEVAQNTAEMVIKGIRDGLTNAMPQITSVVNESDTNESIATKIGNSVGSAINTGLAKAVTDSVENTVKAAVDKFKMAVDTVNSYVQEHIPSEYTITIHVNTSEIDAAVARLNSAVNGVNYNAYSTQEAVVTSRSNAAAMTVQATNAQIPAQEVNVNYTQNNYSPKALSRPEIYRQTRNQLSTIQGVVASATGG